MKKEDVETDRFFNDLRQKVCIVYGKQITSARDCDALANILLEKHAITLNSQTLRRFFGLIKSNSKSGGYTLDALSLYCGYNDFEYFKSVQTNKDLETFFGEDNSEENYCSKAEDLCRRVMSSSKFLVTTHHQLMEFPSVRKFFLEHYPIRDMLGTVYSQYFSVYLKYNNSNEARIFAYGFLFKSAFLQENDELIHLYHNMVKSIKLTTDIFVVPAGMKFGIELLYADYIKDDKAFKKTFLEMKKFRKKYIPNSERSACSFEYSVLELLIFSSRTKEMKYLVDNDTKQIYPDRNFVSLERTQTHKEVWKVLCAATYHKMGDKERCLESLAAINIDDIGIGWNKYYSLLYHLICLQHPDFYIGYDVHDKLENLINETNFSFYRTVLRNVYKNDETRSLIKKIK